MTYGDWVRWKAQAITSSKDSKVRVKTLTGILKTGFDRVIK